MESAATSQVPLNIEMIMLDSPAGDVVSEEERNKRAPGESNGSIVARLQRFNCSLGVADVGRVRIVYHIWD
jgi:hypothetical protein